VNVGGGTAMVPTRLEIEIGGVAVEERLCAGRVLSVSVFVTWVRRAGFEVLAGTGRGGGVTIEAIDSVV
jgi:hypothetical protein